MFCSLKLQVDFCESMATMQSLLAVYYELIHANHGKLWLAQGALGQRGGNKLWHYAFVILFTVKSGAVQRRKTNKDIVIQEL